MSSFSEAADAENTASVAHFCVCVCVCVCVWSKPRVCAIHIYRDTQNMQNSYLNSIFAA